MIFFHCEPFWQKKHLTLRLSVEMSKQSKRNYRERNQTADNITNKARALSLFITQTQI